MGPFSEVRIIWWLIGIGLAIYVLMFCGAVYVGAHFLAKYW